MYAHRVRDPSHTCAYHTQYSHAYPMLIGQGNYLFLVYLWQEIAMVLGVTCPKRDVGVIARRQSMQIIQSQPNSHQKCASTQRFEPAFHQRFPRSSRPVKVLCQGLQSLRCSTEQCVRWQGSFSVSVSSTISSHRLIRPTH